MREQPPDAPSRQSESRHHLGHRVVLDFDGGLFAGLICSEGTCETIECPTCGADLTDPSSDRCAYCEETNPGECHLQSWFEAVDAEELLHGEIEFPVSVEWIDGAPLVQIVGGSPSR